jgi:hypothetical protein
MGCGLGKKPQPASCGLRRKPQPVGYGQEKTHFKSTQNYSKLDFSKIKIHHSHFVALGIIFPKM